MRQCFIDRGRRSSAAVSYLRPARARPNLEGVTGACVTRIVVERGTATGVEYRCGRSAVHAHASREVIVSAGTFNTPQVLMLSGIGPAAQLQAHGIRVVADLPVGRNLQDYVAVALTFSRQAPGPFHAQLRADRMVASLLRAWFTGTGPATMLPGALYAFVKSRPHLEVPDIEFMFRCAAQKPAMWCPLLRPAGEDAYGIGPALRHPKSRGEVTAAFRRSGRSTVHHPARTCRIGSGPEAVVDSSLRVHGIERLRVADASVMPDLVSAHITPAC